VLHTNLSTLYIVVHYCKYAVK